MNADITNAIIGHIDFGTYPAVCLVCRVWREIAARVHDRGAALSPVLLLLDKFGAKCDLMKQSQLSFSKQIPIWFIVEHPHLNWWRAGVSWRSDLTPAIILSNPTFGWSMREVLRNLVLPIEFVISLDPESKHSREISSRRDVTLDIIKKCPWYKWNWRALARICGPKFILEHPELDWDWPTLHRVFSLEFVMNNPQFEWNYTNILYNLIYREKQ